MTIPELKALREQEIVLWDGPNSLPPLVGEVIAVDPRCVEIHWDDNTNAILWFRHAEQARDTRHLGVRIPDTTPQIVEKLKRGNGR